MEYLPINWTDGVKLNSEHFHNNHNNVTQTIKNYNTINQKSYNYGILDNFDDNTASIQFELVNDSSENLTLKLASCNAIVKSGYLIKYNRKLYGDKFVPSKTIRTSDYDANINQTFYIIITVNPFETVPVGVPDPEIIPLHHPYVLPKVSIEVLAEDKMNTSYIKNHFLIIGKLKLFNGKFAIDENYIPPVQKIDYNHQLKSFKELLNQVLLRGKNYSIQIFKKNSSNLKSNKLVENTFVLCHNINEFYSHNIFYFHNIIGEESPIMLSDKLSILANKLSISLAIMNEEDRERLLQYYYEWTDIKPSDFLNTIGDVLSIQYNHIEISETLLKLKYFVNMIDRLLKKMSGLEYIGQRRDNIVVSEDSKISNNKKEDSSWSIFD